MALTRAQRIAALKAELKALVVIGIKIDTDDLGYGGILISSRAVVADSETGEEIELFDKPVFDTFLIWTDE